MSASKWAYDPDICNGRPCPGDCDRCRVPEERIPPEEAGAPEDRKGVVKKP